MYIKINVKKLFDSGLSIESYFLLDCIHKSNKDLIEGYVNKCNKIEKPVVNQLITNGYIEEIVGDITFSKFKLLPKSIKMLGNDKLDHELFYKEFRSEYLVKTPCGRRLHTDPGGCREKYKKLIVSEELHRTILKCVRLYFNELRSTGKLDFAQAMPAWLNQKNYKVYWDDALKLGSNVSEVGGFSSDI